jgi:hypothetical protein
VTHFFSPGRHPATIVRALHDLAIVDVVVDEEVTGDGNWHVAAFTTLPLTAPNTNRAEDQDGTESPSMRTSSTTAAWSR